MNERLKYFFKSSLNNVALNNVMIQSYIALLNNVSYTACFCLTCKVNLCLSFPENDEL